MSVNVIDVGLQFRGSLLERSQTDYLVLHHAEASNASVEDIHRWHLENGWAGIGYHYYIRKDGSIYRGRPRDTIGSHVYHHNWDTIGICAEGDYMSEIMPDAQKSSIIALCQELLTIYPNVQIVGHRDLMSTSCPGVNYPFVEIVSSASGNPVNYNSQQWIIDMQKALNMLGYNLQVDGVIGQNTINAIKDFQAKNGLTPDGIYGMVTAHYLSVAIQKAKEVIAMVGPFQDVPENHWAASVILDMYNRGLLSKDTTFRPDQPITRAEAVALIDRVLKFLGK
jgi:N-acetyl-anhydromuramyl-L-alanine amidase AmpD